MAQIGSKHFTFEDPVDRETLDVGASAIGFTPAKFTANTWKVRFRVQDGPARWTMAGGDPTASDGEPLYDGDWRELTVEEAKKAKFIRTGATNAKIIGHFYEPK